MQDLQHNISALRRTTHTLCKEPDRSGISIKGKVVATVRAALIACGAPPMNIVVYELIADCADRGSWSENGHPICYREQLSMAAELGITDRQFRRIESWLEQFGAIERSTAENGYRGRRRNEDGTIVAAGLSLRPSILNIQVFEALVWEAKARLKRLERLRISIRITRRRIRTRIMSTCASDQQTWQRKLDDIDARLDYNGSCRANEEVLIELHNALEALSARINDGTTEADGDVDNAQKTYQCSTKMSGAPDMKVHRHIQPTTKPNVICNAHANSKTPAGNPADTNLDSLSANASKDCLEKKHVGEGVMIKPEIARLLTHETLAEMASEDLGHYLDAYPGHIEAVQAYLNACGVNRSVWSDAVAVMGEDIAFIATLVLDRNREHPSRRVENLAGALRGLTTAAHSGRMNLTRSIIGLWKREEDGSQPRPKRRVM